MDYEVGSDQVDSTAIFVPQLTRAFRAFIDKPKDDLPRLRQHVFDKRIHQALCPFHFIPTTVREEVWCFVQSSGSVQPCLKASRVTKAHISPALHPNPITRSPTRFNHLCNLHLHRLLVLSKQVQKRDLLANRQYFLFTNTL